MSLDDFVKTYIRNLSIFYCIDINVNDEGLEKLVKDLNEKIKELITNV